MPASETSKTRWLPAALLCPLAAVLCALMIAGTFAPAAQAAGTGTFVERAPSPVPIAGLAADPANGMIYAQQAGGKKFFAFDPRTDAWSELAEAPIANTEAYEGAGATYLEGKIYFAYESDGAEVGVYDVQTGEWTTAANRLGAGTDYIASAGQDIYMLSEKSFISYEPTSLPTQKNELASPPEPMASCPSFLFSGGMQAYEPEGKIFAYGEGCSPVFASYDISTHTWSELSAVVGEEPHLGSAIDPASGTYYTYGGYSSTTFDIYEIGAEKWISPSLGFPFGEVTGGGGLAYVSSPNVSGVYAAQGAMGAGFTVYTHEPLADLSATASLGVGAGNEAVYTLKVENHGPDTATKVILSDALSGNLSFISAQAGQGSCSGTSTITCNLGSLAAGASATVTVKASAKISVAARNTVTVTGETLDPNPANDSETINDGFVITPVAKTITITETKAAPPAVYCVVPNVHKDTVAELKAALMAAHCALGHVSAERDRKVGKGRVIASNPYRGAMLVAGSKVDVLVSRGGGKGRRHARCMVPGKLHGSMLKRAKRRLRAAHCRPGRIIRRRSAKVGSGRVIATRPGHGKKRAAGTRIRLVVSKGHRHRR